MIYYFNLHSMLFWHPFARYYNKNAKWSKYMPNSRKMSYKKEQFKMQ